MNKPNWEIVEPECAPDRIVIRDLGPWDMYPTVTNCVEQVIAQLHSGGALVSNPRLFYYDSEGACDEIVYDGDKFVTFRAGGLG